MPSAAFVYSDTLADFDFGDDHPFKPIRARNTRELCHRYGILRGPGISHPTPEPVDTATLGLFHESGYLELLRRASDGEPVDPLLALHHGLGTEDCPILKGVYEFSALATGATLLAVDWVLSGKVERALNLVGGFHHAGRSHAEGFCYVNDVAVALETLVAKGLRPAFVDIDAHHCNGVQDAFYEDDRVLVLSFHESGETLYPWAGAETEIGSGRGKGFTVNVPLLERSDDEVFLSAYRRLVPPVLDAFRPDLVIAEIGGDMHLSDPLTHLRLTNNGYHAALQDLCGRKEGLVALGGGGYDVYRTARCWALAWSALCGLEPEEDYAAMLGGAMHGAEMEDLRDPPILTHGEAKERAMEHVERVVEHHRRVVFPILGASLS